ncbi:MAG: ABC transporter ATP-binding protein [Pirellulaceae bacterium]|nr:ABC transporter ATP-binding protein [Pirellulaceae bacterium]
MICVKEFHKAYNQTIAVAGISFQVEPGQILGLIGPNGAGKTTTLRALCGIIPISQGKMAVGGFDLRDEPLEAKRRLAYIPDEPQLFEDLSVSQHLAFTAASYQVEDASLRIGALLDAFELASKANTPVGDLSRGMKQKLAVCCGYLHEPTAILFDEPLTGLDPRGIRALKESIIQRANDGAAIIISSHLLAMVEDICSYTLILDHGSQRYFGPLSEVKTEFASHLTAASLEEIFFHATTSGPTVANGH